MRNCWYHPPSRSHIVNACYAYKGMDIARDSESSISFHTCLLHTRCYFCRKRSKEVLVLGIACTFDSSQE